MTTDTARRTRSPGAMIAVVLIASFMDLLDVTIVAVAAPDIRSDLSASPAQVQWLIAGYALALGAALVTGGRIGDQHGRRRVFLGGLGAFVLASAACALAPTPEVLIATRVVQGLAAGLMVPQVFGILRASLTPGQLGAALGAYGGVQGLASIAGPLLGGGLVTADVFELGWRTIFWVNVPIGLIALGVATVVLPDSRGSRSSSRLDLFGALLLAGSLVAILLPVVQGRAWGWPPLGWVVLAAGLVGLVTFVAFERTVAGRGGSPVLDPRLLHNRAFTGGLLASAVFFGGIAPFFLFFTVYLQEGTGRSAFDAGLITLPYAVSSIITSGVGVKLAPRYGRGLLITGSLTVGVSHAVMMLVLAGVDEPRWWHFCLPLAIGGSGLGLAAPPLVNVILASVPERDAGAAGGVLSTANQIGGAVGVAALGALFFGRVAAPAPGGSMRQAFTDALSSSLGWMVALYFLAAVLMSALPRSSETPPRRT